MFSPGELFGSFTSTLLIERIQVRNIESDAVKTDRSLLGVSPADFIVDVDLGLHSLPSSGVCPQRDFHRTVFVMCD